jgi:hypothetical protein
LMPEANDDRAVLDSGRRHPGTTSKSAFADLNEEIRKCSKPARPRSD